jgi:archaellum biogenesis protein FlaJ (TadC family)
MIISHHENRLNNTVEKGQRGAISFIFISILFMLAAIFFEDTECSFLLIIIMAISFIWACICVMVYIRCPNCRKFAGEYKSGPPISVNKKIADIAALN